MYIHIILYIYIYIYIARGVKLNVACFELIVGENSLESPCRACMLSAMHQLKRSSLISCYVMLYHSMLYCSIACRHMFMCIYIYIYMYSCLFIHRFIDLFVYMYIYIYIYTYQAYPRTETAAENLFYI